MATIGLISLVTNQRISNTIKATAALLLAGFEPHVGSQDLLSIPHFRAKKGAKWLAS